MSDNALVVQLQSDSASLMRIIENAINMENFDIDKLQKLLDVKTQWEQAEAKKAYHSAVAAFKAESITIIKSKEVRFGDTKYSHATLGNIVQLVAPVLSSHGLSHSWEIKQDGATIGVTCHLTHVQGYSTHVTMAAGKDDSGKKNQIQQIASTVSYLERYTFLAITGLATQDQDDDGRAAEKPKVETITEEQTFILDNLIKEVKADAGKFCVFYKIESVDALPASKYDSAAKALEAKRHG